MGMVANGHALCVQGNHENKLVRALRGRKRPLTWITRLGAALSVSCGIVPVSADCCGQVPMSVDRLGEGSERLIEGSTEVCELVEVEVSTRKVEALVHQACWALGNTPRKLSDRSSVR